MPSYLDIAHSPPANTVRRWRAPEILQVPTGGVPGRRLPEEKRTPQTHAASLLHRLLSAPESGDPHWHILRHVDAVWITGGGATGFDAAAIAAAIQCRVLLDPLGAFGFEPGGRALLAGAPGLICDLGQTSFKVSWGGHWRTFPRDPARLPTLPDCKDAATIAEQRAALRSFTADALRACCQQVLSRPERVVFALPCWLDAAGVPQGSNYAGLTGDASFDAHSLHLAGLAPAEVFVLNDAKLAAVAALEDPRAREARKLLVLTAGHAYGAALINVPPALARRRAGWPPSDAPPAFQMNC